MKRVSWPKYKSMLLLVSIFSFLAHPTYAGTKKKDCGPIPPGMKSDENCKFSPSVPPVFSEGVAKVIGEVSSVECGSTKTRVSQEYVALIDVKKVLNGDVKSPLRIPFTSYSDGKTHPNERKSMLKGDQYEITIEKFEGGWTVPKEIKPLRVSASMLPSCP